ncbi:hypothetical protein C2G38_2160878 [Gigaspora rosea]|uniref:Uncharacterized protein n=1 Tax=Gigaspora rosea TaxID=44941 RepID=A0A397VZN8_9GLOM|nr:hypothetical protein C2G38_2160878 [Gigaspora rosea]
MLRQPIKRNQIQQFSEIEKAYLNRALLALEGARNIQENDQATPTIFPNTGLTQATQDYLLHHHQQLILETTVTIRNRRTGNPERVGTPIIAEAIGIILQTAFGQYTVYYAYDQINNKRLGLPTEIFNDQIPTLETPKLKEYYKIALISISANQEILEERIKEISIQIIEGEIVDKITETLSYINNTKLGAILLTLKDAKSIAREFYPYILENDKQRPGRIPAHISTRTQTLFPELSGRALVKEKEKQRNIYNSFLENTQIQIEGIKRRLIAESPEFYRISERNPCTGEIFHYPDYNNQFTILPIKFHHVILHHLDAIDNILYTEGAKYKLFFEEEEKEYFKRTGRKIEEYGYCTIASDIKETELEYLEHDLLPEHLFEQYYLFLEKPEDLGETRYIKKNRRKEPANTLLQKLEKLKSDLKAELFVLALRYELKNWETLNIHNCYENEEYWEIVKTIKGITYTIEYKDGYYQSPEQEKKEKQERLQRAYLRLLEELYEKQVGIWIAKLEIPEEETPEIEEEQFPVYALNFGKLSSYEIQTLIKYKKKIQNAIRLLRRIEHKIQSIEKLYKGYKYLSIFEKSERRTIARKFSEDPTIADLSKENTILTKFWNTRFKFELFKNSTNKLAYLKLRLP